MFSTLSKTKVFESANASYIDKSKVLLFVNPLPDNKIVDWSKLKHFKVHLKWKISTPCRVENIVRKGEIACYKQFLLFLQYFVQLYILIASKCGIVW